MSRSIDPEHARVHRHDPAPGLDHEHQHAHGHQHDGHEHDGHEHGRSPEHGHDHELRHEHDHPHHHDHDHPHGGVRGFLYDLFVPHSHDAADSIDDALEASRAGVRALKISLFVLLGTTILQAALVVVTGSVALLADTIHNFADALTAVPLWIAFVLGRRAATRRHTYGYGRAEDLAGLFIVFVVALSAVIAGAEAIDRFIHPRHVEAPWLLVAAGLIGFAGNEAVAIYRIRVGRRIGSAALVADGVHARLDGFTSLSVVLGAIGVLLGFPLADPIIGLIIAISILVLLWSTLRSIGARLMDAIDPALVDRAERALRQTPDIVDVDRVQLRWMGHRLTGSATIHVEETTLAGAARISEHAAAHVREELRNLDDFTVVVR
nr:cation diffusion facilitator family transporter [Actinomycetota bacterium]